MKNRYREFLRILRMWRHTRLLKRGGRAHAPTGVNGTSPGELAVLCPACPHPNINLPMDWTSVAKESQYVLCFLRFCTSTTAANSSKDISTIRPLGSTRAFVSNDVKFPVMPRIRSLVPGLRMWSRGSHTVSTFCNRLIRVMYVNPSSGWAPS